MASPQTIQPSSADTSLNSDSPTTNHGTEDPLSIEAGDRRSILSFAFSASVPAGSTISVATLSMYVSHVASGMPITVSRVLRADWVEMEACWNYYKGTTAWGTAGCLNASTDYTTTNQASANCPASVGWMTWDVKNLVQVALDAVSGVLHLVIGTTSGSGYTQLKTKDAYPTSQAPKLYIEYTAPAAVKPNFIPFFWA